MKKLILFTTLTLSSLVLSQLYAQEAVKTALSSAEIVRYETNAKKLKKEVKTLKSDYDKALKEIASMRSASAKKIENSIKVVDNVQLWAGLQVRMERLKSENKIAFDIAHVDYDSIEADARRNVATYYYNDGRDKCSKAKKYEDVQAALFIMRKANKYSDIYAEAIDNYRDSVELPLAHQLAKSNKEEDRMSALRIFNSIIRRHENDSALVSEIVPDRELLREEFYQAGEKLVDKKNFRDQVRAWKYYRILGDYKDAQQKAALARKRGVLTVSICEKNSDTTETFSRKTMRKVNSHFDTLYYDFRTYSSMQRKMVLDTDCVIMLVYDSASFGQPVYKHNETKVNRDVIKYVKLVDEKGVVVEKEIKEKEYQKGKNLTEGYDNYKMYKGVVNRRRIESSVDIDYSFDVYDLRVSELTPIGKVSLPFHYSETSTDVETYKGDKQCRPEELSNLDKHMTDKDLEQLKDVQENVGWSIEEFWLNATREIDKQLEKIITYRHYDK